MSLNCLSIAPMMRWCRIGWGKNFLRRLLEPKEFLKIHGGHNDGSITVDPSAAGEFIRILKSKDLI